MNNVETIIDLVMTILSKKDSYDETEIDLQIKNFSTLFPISEDEKLSIRNEIHSRNAIKIDRGTALKAKDHVPWYLNAKKDLSHKYWDRYRNYLLQQGFSNQVLNELDRSTDEMLDLVGNPNQESDFQRRGLIIGDVQSGKTSTYTGVINKAADAGYRVIILLTGTIEKLRRQTQERLDEGFVGLDSKFFTNDNQSIYVGVGKIDSSISAWSITSTNSDFNKGTATKLVGRIREINAPVIFVLKKNKSVLVKLEQWLRNLNVDTTSGKVSLPMLLIDDEADNASVNTNEDDSPTVINASIRKLLKLFQKANYVGFTATPYANIFINPDSTDEMLKDDLFPRDFIYSLKPPSNYIGARNIYNHDPDEGIFAEYHYMLKNNDDCEDVLPLNHKNHASPESLPESLIVALVSFFLANTIRDLRDQKGHRTMMINVSRFISVQNNISNLVDSFVRTASRDIRHYSLSNNALDYEVVKLVKKVFDKEYSKLGFSFDTVLKQLSASIASIVVRTVNGSNASQTLNYDEYKTNGLRIIAVGGLSLSRGLTLEGLVISYFYRNSKMYDTLMQMGRWFGYRKNYEDLCRVYMSTDAVSWYKHISAATDELRDEIDRMKSYGMTPIDFGLSVRSDFDTLIVTARNKMRTATEYVFDVNISGKVIETPFLPIEAKLIDKNHIAVEKLISLLFKDGFKLSDRTDLANPTPQFHSVPSNRIVDFLNDYYVNPNNLNFQVDSIIEFISENPVLNTWDIAIAKGSGNTNFQLGELVVPTVMRSFEINNNMKVLQMSGSKSRLGSVSFAKAGLLKHVALEIEKIEKSFNQNNEKKSISQNAYFSFGIKRNPLLVLYPVQLKQPDPSEPFDKVITKEELVMNLPKINWGVSIGIPHLGEELSINRVKYRINQVKYKEIFGSDDFEDEEL
ncbi:MAG: DEAD/DEAH box helicase family protein [Erysipelothrix sp.]|nr:DEAD/DEAH box helicase family protein [Erysipelothrix sp.]